MIDRFRKGASSLPVKRRVLENILKLQPDYWLTRNIEAFQKAIVEGNDQTFDLVCFLNWYAHEFKPASYLEIGVRRGRSMAQVLNESPGTEILGIDLWIENYSSVPESGIHVENPGPDFVRSELAKFACGTTPTLIKGPSADVLPWYFALPNHRETFDLIVVDGDHTYWGAQQDLLICFDHLAEGGVLVFDDIVHPSHRELQVLWNECKDAKPDFIFLEDLSGSGTGVAIRPPFERFGLPE